MSELELLLEDAGNFPDALIFCVAPGDSLGKRLGVTMLGRMVGISGGQFFETESAQGGEGCGWNSRPCPPPQ